jgi:hypothetical protein
MWTAMPDWPAALPLPPKVIMPSMKSAGTSGIGPGLQRNCDGVASASLNGPVRTRPLSMRR